MDQQQQENTDPSRLERMWKSHPWESDMEEVKNKNNASRSSSSKSKSDKKKKKEKKEKKEKKKDKKERKEKKKPAPSLGPAPSASAPRSRLRSRFAAPWRDQEESDNQQQQGRFADDDEISLGDSVRSQEEKKDRSRPSEEKKEQPPPPRLVEETAPVANTTVAKPVPVKADNHAGFATENKYSNMKKGKEAPKVSAAPPPTTKTTTHKKPQKKETVADENAELLAIDFDRDGPALREALAEDILAMWSEQGLYQDMPEIRDELLKGIVDQKFNSLKEEQAKAIEKNQLANMPKLVDEEPANQLMMAITEEEEEEEETSDDEEVVGNGTRSPSLEDMEAHMTNDERIALHAFQVQEQLESQLMNMVDVTEHDCVEASGRLGNLTEREKEKQLAIKDVHAFDRYKLHDAIERRVSQIFTDDHKVVTNFDNDDDDDDEVKDKGMDASNASMPALQAGAEGMDNSMKRVRQDLSTSFSAFEAHLKKKTPSKDENEYDEWTECEVSIHDVNETKPEDIKKLVADMDRKLGLLPGHTPVGGGDNDDEESFMEYTVREDIEEHTIIDEYTDDEDDDKTVDVDELSEKMERAMTPTSEVDVDELSEQSEKKKRTKQGGVPPTQAMPRIIRPQSKKQLNRKASAESSYIEMTVADGTVDDEAKRKQLEILNKQASMSSGLSGKFPTINLTSEMDDDELTQITFDHTMEDAKSTTQDHYIASAYFNKTSSDCKPPSPTRKCGSGNGSSSQQTDPTQQTVPMDESSFSHHERGSVGSGGSRDSSLALSKSVAEILRVKIWSPKAKVVQKAMDKLAHASAQGCHQRANIARLGGVIAILRAMQSHATNLQIQKSGCIALAHLSVDVDTQEAIAEVGGTGAIVTAMVSHPSDQEVQEKACVALSNISNPQGGGGVTASESSSDSDSEDEDSSSSGAGVVQALVTAMTRHPQNAEIQAHAFGALANLCLDNQGRLRELSETGGLTAMTLALQKPWRNKMEQHEAISTLSILLRSLAELGTSC